MDMGYYFEKLHDGTNKTSAQRDKAEYAKVLVPLIREQLQEYQSDLTTRGVNLKSHESAIAQAEQHLNDLERYFDSIISGKKKTLKVDTAREYINFIRDEMAALEKMI